MGNFIQRNFLEEVKKPKLPNPKQILKIYPRIIQVIILLFDLLVILLFCWGIPISFSEKNNDSTTSTSSSTFNGVNVIACFPDIETLWIRWSVLVIYEASAVFDFFSSLKYLKTLTCNCWPSFSYSKHCPPVHSLIVALQSVWIQQVSLNCTDSSATGAIFSFSSWFAGIQTVTIIACILLRFVESKFFCVEKSRKKSLIGYLKVISALLQSVSVGYSLVLWIIKVNSMDFEPSWVKLFVLIAFPTWMFFRLLSYVINIFAHEQEGEESHSITQETQFELVGQQRGRTEYYEPPQTPQNVTLGQLSPERKMLI